MRIATLKVDRPKARGMALNDSSSTASVTKSSPGPVKAGIVGPERFFPQTEGRNREPFMDLVG